MKRISILLFLLVVCFSMATQAQTQAPDRAPKPKITHAADVPQFSYLCQQ